MIIESGDDLRDARERMGLSQYELGELLRLGAGARTDRPANPAMRIREMERGARPIGGPTAVAVEALLSGWRPE